MVFTFSNKKNRKQQSGVKNLKQQQKKKKNTPQNSVNISGAA